jgi:hypothetical protein
MNGGENDEGGVAKAKKGGALQLFKAVAWSFLGVRKRADLEADAAHLNPVALVAAAVVGAALFAGVLLVIVHFVTR